MVITKHLSKLFSIALLSLICGCYNSDTTVYLYEKQETEQNKYIAFKLESSEYSNNQLKIKFMLSNSSDNKLFSKVNSWVCFNKDFDIIEETKFLLQDNYIIIESPKAKEISGIKFDTDFARFAIRYLDSKAYAIVEQMFVFDEGEHEIGETDLYYTEQEKKNKRDLIIQKKDHSNKAFNYILGSWESEDHKFKLDVSESKENSNLKILKILHYDQNIGKMKDVYQIKSDTAYYNSNQNNKTISISVSTGNMTRPIFIDYSTEDQTIFIQLDETINLHKIQQDSQ